ncbi:hypothetical protein MBLNU230_g4698t1 [Neophaeotheca triangularis]
MAVPPSATTHNLTGTYILNRTLSDSTQAVLKQQGVGFIVRQAAAYSNVTISINHSTDQSSKTDRIDLEQTSTGGLKSEEQRVLDGQWREKEDKIWGKVKGATSYVQPSQITEDAYLLEGWSSSSSSSNENENNDLIRSEVHSQSSTWTALQIWGFAQVDGQRRHVRRVLAKKGDEVLRIRLVYDWQE